MITMSIRERRDSSPLLDKQNNTMENKGTPEELLADNIEDIPEQFFHNEVTPEEIEEYYNNQN